MTYTYRLAGENLELAEAELEGFLKSQRIDEKPETRNRLAEIDSEPNQLKRLALTHEITQKIGETSNLDNFTPDWTPEDSFSVKCKILEGEADNQRIEEKLGEKLSTENNEVDLENPETEIYVYVLGGNKIIGKLVQDIDRGLFNKRSNEKRPFSSPVSLDPVLARVLVNLSKTPAGGKLLDPFCGTGGILIEAGLCGIQPLGTDTKKEMVKGTKENLEKYGIISHEISQKDAEKSLSKFGNVDAIVTDLPYGKASKVEGEIEEKFLDLIKDFDGKTVFMYDKPNLGDMKAEFEIYVHKNLTRYIYSLR
ncbi:THUMP domain-containing protein [Candidatus Nanohalobium constans]|uniref:tRNA (Guanine10-N2)-dimethyltransferase n=1 Tax=Candidatus Nanohalobium constans TaxID=2565781 RepID=A0A5Q0UF15_9ARCH|nr:THUMP domain-containing protein [Candidatus Nanohalobium constans]QGA80148.1 tRNA (guanine10-N2)-dimethyltransferase [Candidatus Nanohalobium constans]